jgi:hypothetical protein
MLNCNVHGVHVSILRLCRWATSKNKCKSLADKIRLKKEKLEKIASHAAIMKVEQGKHMCWFDLSSR